MLQSVINLEELSSLIHKRIIPPFDYYTSTGDHTFTVYKNDQCKTELRPSGTGGQILLDIAQYLTY